MVFSNKPSMRISRFTCANYYYYRFFAGNVHNLLEIIGKSINYAGIHLNRCRTVNIYVLFDNICYLVQVKNQLIENTIIKILLI